MIATYDKGKNIDFKKTNIFNLNKNNSVKKYMNCFLINSDKNIYLNLFDYNYFTNSTLKKSKIRSDIKYNINNKRHYTIVNNIIVNKKKKYNNCYINYFRFYYKTAFFID
jgi:hypothetical protein